MLARAVVFASPFLATSARADPPAPASPVPPTQSAPGGITGIERPERQSGDVARDVGSALLYVPRATVELVFFATGAASGLLQDQQVVPRVRDLVSPPPGEIGVFPTAFAETGHAPNVGARMIARGDAVATSLRAGFGGLDEIAIESRIRVTVPRPLPIAVSTEALYERNTDLDYLGVGERPEEDARNHFQGGVPGVGLYRERKARGLVSVGLRPTNDVELFLSSSITRRRIDDPPDSGAEALSQVFDPGTVPGSSGELISLYSELAIRLDTRETRALPSPGFLVEGYAGSERGIDDDTRLVRYGGRFATFIPVLRRSNIFSQKIVIDDLVAPNNVPIPFTELTRQPEFRGIDNRRDALSIVGSLDYRFTVIRYVALRLFVDLATVAPSLSDVDLAHMRPAVGFSLDLFGTDSDIGQLAFSYCPDGARVLLSFGVPNGFGDRQHRD